MRRRKTVDFAATTGRPSIPPEHLLRALLTFAANHKQNVMTFTLGVTIP